MSQYWGDQFQKVTQILISLISLAAWWSVKSSERHGTVLGTRVWQQFIFFCIPLYLGLFTLRPKSWSTFGCPGMGKTLINWNKVYQDGQGWNTQPVRRDWGTGAGSAWCRDRVSISPASRKGMRGGSAKNQCWDLHGRAWWKDER